MNGKGKIRYVFTSSNTGKGFYTFIPGLLEGLKKVYILKGAVGAGKATFIRLLGDTLSEQGYEIEFWMSANDPMNPEGLYIMQMEMAVINGNLPVSIDPKYPGITGSIINLSEYLDEDINKYSQDIIELVGQLERQAAKADAILEQASMIKEAVMVETSEYLNENKLNKLITRLENEILKDKTGEKHYFATSLTAEGIVNYIDEISSGCKIRYLLKGPDGSGKTQVINEIALRARDKGYFVEFYHCGLNPENMSMVIITNLHLAIIDAGDMENSIRPWDVLIDMTNILDEGYKSLLELDDTRSRRQYETLLMEAQSELETAHKARKNLKRLYSGAMKFEEVDEKRREILNKITNLL